MKYTSTRGNAPAVDFRTAMMAGLAPDGGLYVPVSYPRVSPQVLGSMRNWSYVTIAAHILMLLAGKNTYPYSARSWFGHHAYKGFENKEPLQMSQVGNFHFLELYHGPTLAFKDMAMQIVSLLMEDELRRLCKKMTVVCATSGDTGGAAVKAFEGKKGINMVVLFPRGRVSDVQRKMMTTSVHNNVHALEIDGTFDDCQTIVKKLFADKGLVGSVGLSGVNSINWARIAMQVPYYFWACAQLAFKYPPGNLVDFTVPTGNFGDIFAGYVAKMMGAPIGKLIIATNENNILHRVLTTGAYRVQDVEKTTSPSMDIQVSSNFERLLFEVSGSDGGLICDMMADLSQKGEFLIDSDLIQNINDAGIFSGHASQSEVEDAIRQYSTSSEYLMDPHTAVAACVAKGYVTNAPWRPMVVVSTAAPAKFPETMKAILGRDIKLPPHVVQLLGLPEKSVALPADAAAVRSYMMGWCAI